MDSFYYGFFAVMAFLAAVSIFFESRTAKSENSTSQASVSFRNFRNNYIVVYSLMMAGDWLQGPYVYALYEHYGYSVGDIGKLFIAGFGSSMIFGTVVGALADRHVLMIGRLLGGIATSLLFSAFESWVVAEHFKRSFDESWLGDTFSKATFLGNGLMAVLAGLLANTLVLNLNLGPVAPFDAAIVVLMLGGVIINLTWEENYGDEKHRSSLVMQFSKAAAAITGDKKIALLGAMQSLFEASMYTFVFLWTPALSPNGEKIPHGFIFACYMVASMVGSALAGTLMNYHIRIEAYMKVVFGCAALTLVVPCFFHFKEAPKSNAAQVEVAGTDAVASVRRLMAAAEAPAGASISMEGAIQLVAFCLFEVLVGIFWPSMMTMRARYVPEELRSTIINCFRIPLNLFVCVILYNVSMFPLAIMFALCGIFLLIAMGCQMQLDVLAQRAKKQPGALLIDDDGDSA